MTERTPLPNRNKTETGGNSEDEESVKDTDFTDCVDDAASTSHNTEKVGQGRSQIGDMAGLLSENVISAISKVQLSTFRPDRPDLWFFIVESDFAASRITRDDTKYIAVLKALDSHMLDEISDVVLNPPARDKYNHLKKVIIQRFSKSKERQLSKLLNDATLGNKKPSQLLREMRELAGGGLSEDVLHSLWLMRMPTNMQPMLMMSNNIDLNGLAEMADRVLDTTSFSQVMATTTVPPKSQRNCSDCSTLAEEVQELRQMVAQLLKNSQLGQQSKDGNNNSSNNNQQGNQRRSRSRSFKPHRNGICFYHQRYGDVSYKCIRPCSYKPKTNQGN
ncbi:uncharacterized protein [Venturia canescens]|uniref:uncharacterized protein n=1 Tax=Venturia canescens TaxID=32260 RepID=UPI001C9C0361|nr:uncharacterized protein LOC122406620 [Venturia canescens]